MRTEQILRELSETDDTYLLEAMPGKQKPHMRWGAIAAAAAVLLLAGGVTAFALTHYTNSQLATPAAPTGEAVALVKPTESVGITPTEVTGQTENNAETPTGIDPASLQTITLSEYLPGAMGFEGLLAYDITELEGGNPWREGTSPIYLPVYENTAWSPVGFSQSIGEDTAREKLAWITASLGLTVGDAKAVYEPPYDDEEPAFSYLKADGNGLHLFVWASGSVQLVFDPDCPMLPDITFPVEDENISDTQAQEIMQALIARYAQPLGLENPKAALFGDYTFSGCRLYNFAMYDAGTHNVQAIGNFAFRRVQFGYADGKLYSIGVMDGLSAVEKLGDYPIINPEQAEALLREGHYQTSVPHVLTEEDEIADVELAYRSGAGEQVFLPYYRFFVDLTESKDVAMPETAAELGLKLYGVYYVPAIEPAFIENMPTYDGSFN